MGHMALRSPTLAAKIPPSMPPIVRAITPTVPYTRPLCVVESPSPPADVGSSRNGVSIFTENASGRRKSSMNASASPMPGLAKKVAKAWPKERGAAGAPGAAAASAGAAAAGAAGASSTVAAGAVSKSPEFDAPPMVFAGGVSHFWRFLRPHPSLSTCGTAHWCQRVRSPSNTELPSRVSDQARGITPRRVSSRPATTTITPWPNTLEMR